MMLQDAKRVWVFVSDYGDARRRKRVPYIDKRDGGCGCSCAELGTMWDFISGLGAALCLHTII